MASSQLTLTSAPAADDDEAYDKTLRSCANEPDFAVICAFLQKFAHDLGVDMPNFKHLQDWLTRTDEGESFGLQENCSFLKLLLSFAVNQILRDLHIKLLRKTRRIVHEKCWETALSKFCFSYSAQDAWEIERFGYKNASTKIKLRILRVSLLTKLNELK